MSKEKTNENVLTVESVLARIKELNTARALVEDKTGEVQTHEKDLAALETVKGKDSSEYLVKEELLKTTTNELKTAQEKVDSLTFKKSELKPVFDEVAKKFEEELRKEQEREFHIEIGPRLEENEEDLKTKQNAGRKAYKTLMEYLYKNVNWTAKTAAGLMVLVRNMEENKPWVQSADFDNIITLRSSNVLVLWRNILEEMTGKGYYEAKGFLECWVNCGQGITNAVRDIQKLHEDTRELGTQLNTIEDEYDRSVDDLPTEVTEEVTTKDEVAPEI